MPRLAALAALATLAALPACGGSPYDGSWAGSWTLAARGTSGTVQLQVQGQDVTGTGESGGASFALSGHLDPHGALSLACGPCWGLDYRDTVHLAGTARALAGRLSASATVDAVGHDTLSDGPTVTLDLAHP